MQPAAASNAYETVSATSRRMLTGGINSIPSGISSPYFAVGNVKVLSGEFGAVV